MENTTEIKDGDEGRRLEINDRPLTTYSQASFLGKLSTVSRLLISRPSSPARARAVRKAQARLSQDYYQRVIEGCLSYFNLR